MIISQKLARDLLPLVNLPDNHSLLVEYAEFRIQELFKELEHAQDTPTMYKLQGQIKELRTLIGLQAHVRASVKDAN